MNKKQIQMLVKLNPIFEYRGFHYKGPTEIIFADKKFGHKEIYGFSKEIRVWVHLDLENHTALPVTYGIDTSTIVTSILIIMLVTIILFGLALLIIAMVSV